ncbi:hypothetical protein ACIBIZ_49770 [Nonomuraea spiralis]|uniref:hypothetical protein n=1 Tax=Nonomuraea spiralis TaxID=46182 RepID=UPI00379E879D
MIVPPRHTCRTQSGGIVRTAHVAISRSYGAPASRPRSDLRVVLHAGDRAAKTPATCVYGEAPHFFGGEVKGSSQH